MILSDHAREEMLKDGISEEDVRQCLEHGRVIIENCVNGEMRYGEKLAMKDRSVIAIYTFRLGEPRVITAYTVNDQRWRK